MFSNGIVVDPSHTGLPQAALFQKWSAESKACSEVVNRIQRRSDLCRFLRLKLGQSINVNTSDLQTGYHPIAAFSLGIPLDTSRRADGILAAIYKPVAGYKPIQTNKSRIPASTLALLESAEPSHGNPATKDYAILRGLINSGHSDEQIQGIFLRYPNTRFYRGWNDGDRRKVVCWLSRSIEQARKRGDSEATEQFRSDMRLNQAWANQIVFANKRTANRDRQVLSAIIGVARKACKSGIRVSTRTLASMTLMHQETVNKAIKSLAAQGFLTTHGFTESGTLIRLNLDAILAAEINAVSQEPHSNRAYVGMVNCAADETSSQPHYCAADETSKTVFVDPVIDLGTSHELFAPPRFGVGSKQTAFKPGLGKSCERIYRLLNVNPMAFEDLLRVSGFSRATVWRNLGKLQECIGADGEIWELVEKIDGLWQTTGVDLDEASKSRGTTGKRRRQKTMHDIERGLYRTRIKITTR